MPRSIGSSRLLGSVSYWFFLVLIERPLLTFSPLAFSTASFLANVHRARGFDRRVGTGASSFASAPPKAC
eukprot:245879-Pyramimonas_sp.AAC.1